MRFLESCDFAVVRALRSAGYDVLAVSEFQQRSVDQQLMELAYTEGRILLTCTRLQAARAPHHDLVSERVQNSC